MTPLPSYTIPRDRDWRDQARIRRLHHLALAAAICLFGLALAHTALDAALNLTADLARAKAGAGW